MNREGNDKKHWVIEAVRIAPAEHKGSLGLFLLALCALAFIAVLFGGAAAHDHDGGDDGE